MMEQGGVVLRMDPELPADFVESSSVDLKNGLTARSDRLSDFVEAHCGRVVRGERERIVAAWPVEHGHLAPAVAPGSSLKCAFGRAGQA